LNGDAAFPKFDLLEPGDGAMTSTIQLIILTVLGALFGLSALSRRYPHIGWLRAFYIKRPQLSEEQRARMQRRANIHVAIQFILLGFGVPVVYVASSVIRFSDPSTVGIAISGIIGFALIVLGIIAIWSNRRRPRPPNRDLDFYKRVTGRSWEPPAAD
jgi:hypothetical protein